MFSTSSIYIRRVRHQSLCQLRVYPWLPEHALSVRVWNLSSYGCAGKATNFGRSQLFKCHMMTTDTPLVSFPRPQSHEKLASKPALSRILCCTDHTYLYGIRTAFICCLRSILPLPDLELLNWAKRGLTLNSKY